MTKERKLEEEFARTLAEFRILEGTVRELVARIGVLDMTLSELRTSSNTLEGIKGKVKGTKLFVPIGGGSYIKASLDDSEKIIIGIGANVALEKGINEALEMLRERATEISEARMRLERQSIEIRRRMGELRTRLEELARKLRRT